MNGRGTIMNQRKDRYFTPDWAVESIINQIPKDVKTIWECACGEKNISKVLEKHGYNVISTDIVDGFDFLTDKMDKDFDMILTNPPFSLKTEFLEKCYEYEKPFLLLLPITILESNKRMMMYKQYGVQFFMLPKRVNFISSYEEDKNKKSSAPFFSIWIGLINDNKNTITFL